MINFKKLFETVYEPKSGDEKNFKAKHIVAKYKTPYDTESQFTSDKPKAKRIADHDKGEDEAVYEAAELHTKRADKKPVIVRAVDPKTGQSKAKTVMRRAGEIKIGEVVELDEKVGNAYAIGMATAMKAAGDTPPLKKSTIVKGHEIAKSIMKKEAMDPVGKADADIDNDGDVDKSDKYLHARRKAISKAIRKEEADQLDELSPNTLHKYIKKATPEVAARAISAVAPNQSAETKKHASKLGKRIAGITSASGRLSDKANQYEEVEMIDEISKDTLKSYAAKSYNQANTLVKQSLSDQPKSVQKASTAAFKRRSAGIKAAGRRLGSDEMKKIHSDVVREEVEMIDEAVKIGAMKLHDGSTVNVTREMADSLNGVFEQLNPMNRVKMEQKLHTSKKDFEEILKFAETVNG